MRRPSFQFYPADWLGNTNLRRCTHAEKGAWIDVVCLMHDSEQYGVLRWPLIDIARAIGCSRDDLQALVSKGVLKGSDSVLDEPFAFAAYSARQYGPVVTLIPAQPGPIWFSSRMVRDEHIRKQRGKGTRFGDSPNQSPNTSPTHRVSDDYSPTHRVSDGFGDSKSDGPSSSSSSSVPALPSQDEGVSTEIGKRRPIAQKIGAENLSNGGGDDF